MNRLTVLIVMGLALLLSRSCVSVGTGVNWEKANERCRAHGDSLVNILDVQNHFSYFKGLQPIWSSVKGHFTPWIAYRGCFRDINQCLTSRKGNFLATTSCHILNNNTVGNCFFECKAKNYTNGGCANNVQFFFGLKGTICLCMCNYNLMPTLSESYKCNFMCRGSINNGECGGLNHISVYESTTVALPDTRFGGFCLTCQPQSHSSNVKLYSWDCNINAAGYCVQRNGKLSLQQWNSTFDSYWGYCRNNNLYIVSDTSQICNPREKRIWTGLRQYKIDNSNIDNDSCYIIEIKNGTANYNEQNCTEHHFFICEKEIGQKNFLSTGYIKSTKITLQPSVASETSWTSKTTFLYKSFSTKENTMSHSIAATHAHSLKSRSNKATIAGASIAGILALSIAVLLVVCLLKRRRFQRLQAEQQTNPQHVTNNTTYDDLVVNSQRQEGSHTYTTLSYNNQAN